MAKIIITGKAMAEVDLKVLWLDSCIVHRWGWNEAAGVSPVWRFYWNRNPDAAAIAFAGQEYSLGPQAALLIAPNTVCWSTDLHPARFPDKCGGLRHRAAW